MAVPEIRDPFNSEFLSKLERLRLLASRRSGGGYHAERRSRATGFSLEFADYREYTYGDDPRAVDWSIYGRLEKLFLKLYEQEEDVAVFLLIDASRSMRWQPEGTKGLTKYDRARQVAAALAYVSLSRLDRVDVWLFDSQLRANMGLARGKAAFHSVLEFLRTDPAPGTTTDLSRSLRDFSRRLKRRGIAIVLSDFFDPGGWEEGLSALHHGRFEVRAVQVTHEAEWNPGVQGDVRIEDCETGETADQVVDARLRASYLDALQAHTDAIETWCRKRGLGFAGLRTDTPVDEFILGALRKRAIAQ